MELRLPTRAQLKTVYHLDLKSSFPPAELKPLRSILRMLDAGRYRPYCLFDGDDIVGECFLCLGEPGWALLDYLCVSQRRRNAGLGALLLDKLRQAETDTVVFGEAEVPEFAPDPQMARRRLNFYRRGGAQFAGFTSDVFGVPYHIFYWADAAVPDRELMARYDYVYRSTFTPSQYAKFIRIPRDPQAPRAKRVPWTD